MVTKLERYSTAWFHSFLTNSATSASRIAPILLELTGANSVVDLGCGLGVWLREFERLGVADVLGVDGDYVDPSALLIPPDLFLSHDLSRPLVVPRRFELATCLEVAEHLPASAADSLVGSLASLAPVVFFSAAIPAQGGTQHVNEQWPEYWVERFQRLGYLLVDAVRPRIWDDPQIDFWYAQNAVLFVDQRELAAYPQLAQEVATRRPLSLVHPRLFMRTRQALESTFDYRLRQSARRLRHSRKYGGTDKDRRRHKPGGVRQAFAQRIAAVRLRHCLGDLKTTRFRCIR